MGGRVEGKVAFITGAARGQGRSHALRLAEEGADIIAIDLCDDVESVKDFYPGATEADLAETVRAVEALGREIFAAKADVRDYEALKAALEEGVAQLGHLDIVSANAGIFLTGLVQEIDEAAWTDIIEVNLTGVWHTCKAVIPTLIEQGTGGSIVITSSVAGISAMPNIAHYAASKHGVVGLMRTMVLELSPYNIRVNTLHPTGVATDMIVSAPRLKRFLPDAEHPTVEEAAAVQVQKTKNALRIPWVESIDVSNALLFLASDEARYITGTELKIDAGHTLKP